jgi:hypothetical protein
MRSLALGLLVLFAAPAFAGPLKVQNGDSLRVRIKQKSQSAIGLRWAVEGWSLKLRDPRGERAEVYDLTAGTMPTKWVVALEQGTVLFDLERFQAGHAYRVVVRDKEAIIYLEPPAKDEASHVVFVDEDDKSDKGDIAIMPKSAL